MIPRRIYSLEHEQFRETVRKFIATEITPHHRQWERDGVVSREVWTRAGEAGLLCVNVPEAYGGVGADFSYNAVLTEELGRAGATGPGFSIHSDMAAAYLNNFGSEEQKLRWLPRMADGSCIAAIGLTEPGAGSDFKAINTRAVRDGEHYLINGQKTYISNGQLCDIVILACKTDAGAGARGISFIIVESDRPGFERGRNLEKLGLKAQDTSELFFNDVRVPAANLIGKEGEGFRIAMHNLAEERLSIATSAIGACSGILEQTVAYTKERKAFGRSISEFQNTRFRLAELSAQLEVLRVFVDRCVELAVEGCLEPTAAAMAKMLCGELQYQIADQCLQFYGGAGYMLEYPIAHYFIDARIRRIAGGSSEVMREIISRSLFS